MFIFTLRKSDKILGFLVLKLSGKKNAENHKKLNRYIRRNRMVVTNELKFDPHVSVNKLGLCAKFQLSSSKRSQTKSAESPEFVEIVSSLKKDFILFKL